MSLVTDALTVLDSNLDLVSTVSLTNQDHDDDEQRFSNAAVGAQTSPRVVELLRIVKALSQYPTSDQRLQASRIEKLLLQSGLAERYSPQLSEDEEENPEAQDVTITQIENDVEWLLLGKAAVQTYGLVLQTFLDQIIPLSDDIWYWDDITHSYSYSCLYTVQSSPLRMWAWTTDIYQESILRFQRLGQTLVDNAPERPRRMLSLDEVSPEEREGRDDFTPSLLTLRKHADANTEVAASWRPSLSTQWRKFYSIVRESIAERAISDLRRRVLSPIDVCRAEARKKRANLRKVRAITAAGLGMLMAEGLNFNAANDDPHGLGWRGLLERSVSLMDMLLQNIVTARDFEISAFEDRVFAMVAEDPDLSVKEYELNTTEKTSLLARRLLGILQERIPWHVNEFSVLRKDNGRPSRIVRYWLPALTLIASSSTILRILVRRQKDIMNWIQELGKTTRDFYLNWVVEPVRKIVGTIRHDTNSEIALMSRDSLKADRDSLERMVVDFALDKPDIAVGTSSITESQVAEIRAKVREGDVTPILKAYEKDLRQPFVGAVRGDLVRALLVQIQKTKVDIEVAMSGIDALLKSQELVFGFVGLTPGVLVSLAVFRYLGAIFGGREGMRRSQKARRSVRVLRKIYRILSEAIPREQKLPLSYKDHGLIICEVHVLRNLSRGVLPSNIEKEFFEDLSDLANLRSVEAQLRTVDRIRWAYPEVWK